MRSAKNREGFHKKLRLPQGFHSASRCGRIFRKPLILMVGATGIEPVTPSMSTRCSPAELRAPLGWRSAEPSEWSGYNG